MNTTDILSPEKQQDEFTLLFLQWLKTNFLQINDEEYLDIKEQPIPGKQACWTAGECLALYHKQQIPPLPTAIHDKKALTIELRKEISIDKETFNEKIWYCVYLDGSVYTCHYTEDQAMDHIRALKEHYKKYGTPKPTVETLYSETITSPIN